MDVSNIIWPHDSPWRGIKALISKCVDHLDIKVTKPFWYQSNNSFCILLFFFSEFFQFSTNIARIADYIKYFQKKNFRCIICTNFKFTWCEKLFLHRQIWTHWKKQKFKQLPQKKKRRRKNTIKNLYFILLKRADTY